jgi:hypothetical protein
MAATIFIGRWLFLAAGLAVVAVAIVIFTWSAK